MVRGPFPTCEHSGRYGYFYSQEVRNGLLTAVTDFHIEQSAKSVDNHG